MKKLHIQRLCARSAVLHGLRITYLVLPLAVCAQDHKPIVGLPFGRPIDRHIEACYKSPPTTDYCSLSRALSPQSGPGEYILQPFRSMAFAIPTWLRGTVSVNVSKDGNIGSLWLRTTGPGNQLAVIESVAARYGEPTRKDLRQARNAVGATWDVYRVAWELPEIRITYDCYTISECLLIFRTPAQFASEEERYQQRRERDKL